MEENTDYGINSLFSGEYPTQNNDDNKISSSENSLKGKQQNIVQSSDLIKNNSQQPVEQEQPIGVSVEIKTNY